MTVQLPEITGGTDKQNAYATAIRQEFVDAILRYDPTESGMAFLRSLTNPNAVVWLDAKSRGRLGSWGTEFFMELAEFGQDSELWQGRAGIGHTVYGKYLKPLQAPTDPPSAPPPSAPEQPTSGSKDMNQLASDLRAIMQLNIGEARAKLQSRLEGVSDEEAVDAAKELGLGGVQGVWSLRGAVEYPIAQADQKKRAEVRDNKAGLHTQPSHQVVASRLPEKQPLEVVFLDYAKVQKQTRGRGKTMPRQPKEGEVLAKVRRPQLSPKAPGGPDRGFVLYTAGDVINSAGRQYVVQAAPKEGYTRVDDDGEPLQWEQLLVLRAATDTDLAAVANQQSGQEAKHTAVMDRAMNS